jgi:hypothetical protein
MLLSCVDQHFPTAWHKSNVHKSHRYSLCVGKWNEVSFVSVLLTLSQTRTFIFQCLITA